MLEMVKKLYEQRDLDSLKKLAKPRCRVLNKTKNFHSVLMLSCHNIKHLSKIESLEADCIILNLEDGVSKEDKPFALVLCAIFLSLHVESSKKLVVRVNALDDGGIEEMKFLNSFKPDGIRVPKVKSLEDVEFIQTVLDKEIELHLSIETKEAWANLNSLNKHKNITAYYLGILDLFADMKLSQTFITLNNPTLKYMLSHFLVTSKTTDVKPISFVYQDFKNLDEFKSWIELEKQMGFDAKGCISPKQVELLNALYVEDSFELYKAKKIVKLFEQNQKKGVTGFVDDEFGFIDEPIYKGAFNYLKNHK